MRNPTKFSLAMLTAILVAFLLAPLTLAQERMSDKDVENTMKNLKQDSKTFESTFNSAISKSVIRKTTQEKENKALVKSFQDQTETMLSVFQDKTKADTTLPGVLTSAKQIDEVLANVSLGQATQSAWAKCKAELTMLATAFQMQPPK